MFSPAEDNPLMNELRIASVLPFSRVEPLMTSTRLATFPSVNVVVHRKHNTGKAE
jgi:hypothetical protein